MDQANLQWLDRREGLRIAYRQSLGAAPTLVFLPGYMSDMDGAKAQAIAAFAAAQGLGSLRFDYSGTGASEGSFEEGTLDSWLEDSLAVTDQLTRGPLVLIGSSMGGWLALHLALARRDRVVGIVGIAAAPDFTEWAFDEEDRQRLKRDGKIEEALADGTPGRRFTEAFWRSGQERLLLNAAVDVECPVRLIHGEKDADVPLEIPYGTMERVRSSDVQLTIVKGGGHRLSAPHEIEAILAVLGALLNVIGQSPAQPPVAAERN
jgi:pimeloyl-ACP methyl ester carboxylesterase